MTEPDAPSAEMKVPEDRPVDWTLVRRLRFFGGVGLMCAALCIVIELLFADVRGGRALNMYDPRGWSDLGPGLWGLALAGPAVGLMVAFALPLYRRRYGGVFVGLLVYLAFLAGLIVGGRIGETHHSGAPSPDGLEFIQGLVFFIGFGVIAAALGQEGRAMALGEPDDGSSWSWPSW